MVNRTSFWQQGIRWLSFYQHHMVKVHCNGCSLRKAYRVASVLERIGDVSVDSVPVAIARAVGCDRIDLIGHGSCRLEVGGYELLNKPPSPMEFLKFPPDAHRLADTELGNVPDWYVLSGFCRCGYFRNVDLKKLRQVYPATARTDDIATHLKCKRCNNKTGNFFLFQRMLR